MSEQLASRPGAERKRGSLEREAIRTRRALLVILLLGGIEGGLYLRGLRPSLSFTSEDYEKLVAALTTFGKGLEGIAGHLDALEDMAPPLSEEGTWISDRGGRILVAAGDEPQIQSPIDCEADEKAAEEARLVVEGTAAPIPPGGYQGRFCLPAEEAAKIDYSMEMGVQPREGISARLLTVDPSGTIRELRLRTGEICDARGENCTQWELEEPSPESELEADGEGDDFESETE